MGLSKRLGGGGTGSNPGASAEPPGGHLGYTWSTQAYTVREILARFQLPCVVQCLGSADTTTVSWEPSAFRFDLRQPLLLHAARTIRKVHARSLRARDASQGPGRSAGELLEEFGPPLAIPEDYDGWFYPIGRHNSSTATVHTLPRHSRVEGAAASAPRQFLVTTPLPAFSPAKVTAGSGGKKYVPHEVGVGEVLTKVGIVKGEPSAAGGSGIASVPSVLIPRFKQSLRCLDENRQEVIVPFSCRSLLYDVAENYGPAAPAAPAQLGMGSGMGGNSHPGVVDTRTIVEAGNSCLPRLFKHVLGDPPALADAFTGVLRCYSVFTEETVMAATMSRASLPSTVLVALASMSPASAFSSFLELSTDSTTKFNIALNASELKKTAQYGLALKTCEEQAPSFVRAIKVSFTLHPVVSAVSSETLPKDPGGGGDVTEQLLSVAVKLQAEQEAEQAQGAQSKGNPECFDSGDDNQRGTLDREIAQSEYGGATKGGRDLTENSGTDTDEIPDSASLSDATDTAEICDGSSASDIAEDVDANSEFDFSWGQLKRAQSFEGSLSSLETDSGTISSCSISECSDCDSVKAASVVAAGHKHVSNSSATPEAKTASSSFTSEDTVVHRASAPSPIYVNVQKKSLSVFGASSDTEEFDKALAVPEIVGTMACGINDSREENRNTNRNSGPKCVTNLTRTELSASCDSVCSSPVSDTGSALSETGENRSRVSSLLPIEQQPNLLSRDYTMRSGWNITSIPAEARNPSVHHVASESKTGDLEIISDFDISGDESEHVCWGDDSSEPEQNTGVLIYANEKANEERSQKGNANADANFVKTAETTGVQITQSCDLPTSSIVQYGLDDSFALPRKKLGHAQLSSLSHMQLSAQSSTQSLSSCSSLSTQNSHDALTSVSSVQSDGSAQDMAIQRLERALSEATHFLQSSAPPPTKSLRSVELPKEERSPPPFIRTSISLLKESAPPHVRLDALSRTRMSLDQKSSPNVQQRGDSSSLKHGTPVHVFGLRSSQTKLPDLHEGSETSKTGLCSWSTAQPSVSAARPGDLSAASATAITSSGGGNSTGDLSAASTSAITSSGGGTSTGDLFAASTNAITFSGGGSSAGAYRVVTSTSSWSNISATGLGSTPNLRADHSVYHFPDKKAKGFHSNDSRISAENYQNVPHTGEPRTDLDFVKTLGDRLIFVSRLSSLPKYQRLEPDSDVAEDSSYDSQQELTPRMLSAAESVDSLAEELTPVAATVNWDDRQDEVVV